MTEVARIRLDDTRLRQITAEIAPRAEKLVAETAYAVEGKAKENAPVDTGALRNSIGTEQKAQFTYWVQDGVEYGIFQELGTSRMAAHPFLTPAVESIRSAFEKRWTELFR